MDPLQILMGIGVLAAWAVLAITIRRWGPSFANRSIRCPTKKVRARVRVEQREGEFGSLLTTDVKTCSLFPDAPLACDKGCLARF